LIARSGISGLCDGSTQNCPNQPNFCDPNYQRRGNLTGTTSFASAASQSGPVSSFTQYDVAGNPVASIDGLSIKTTFSYADAFCNASTCGGTFIPNTYALPSGTTSPVPDPTGQYGATTSLTTSSVYDFWTGQVTSFTDANNQKTEAHYNDQLDRPTQVIRAVGTLVVNQSTFSYDDVAGIVTTTADLNSYGDNILKSQTLYDGLGRVIETRKYETAADYIVTQQVPFVVLQDGSNWLKASQISNPFRRYLNEQPDWTTTFEDSLGRVIKMKTPDNAVVVTGYSGSSVTVTDQAGKRRRSVTDALGRLIQVTEDPEVPGGPPEMDYQTTYTYDVLDNLVKVTQGGQQRFFMYDSLKRLIRARNPEQGTFGSLALSDPITSNSVWSMGYEYDSNGNLTKKTDPRGVEITYVYDALNRNTTTNYSDTTVAPDVKRFYDGATNGKGRFW
jgi:YD repeat-containing protein